MSVEKQKVYSESRDILQCGLEGIAGEDATVALKRSDTIDLIKEKLGLGKSKAYELFNAAVAAGVMRTNDKKHYFLKQS